MKQLPEIPGFYRTRPSTNHRNGSSRARSAAKSRTRQFLDEPEFGEPRQLEDSGSNQGPRLMTIDGTFSLVLSGTSAAFVTSDGFRLSRLCRR